MTTPSVVTDDKRERILEAALALFGERTYGGTAMPLIAERARVGAGTIYRYFRSKEELVNELYRSWKLAFGEFITSGAPAGVPVREQFAHWWARLLAFADHHPDALTFLESQQHAAYLDDASRAVSAGVTARAVEVVRAGQATGEVREGDPAVLVAMVFGAYVALVKGRAAGELAWSPDVREQTELAAWDLLRARP